MRTVNNTNNTRIRYIFRKPSFVLAATLSVGLGDVSPGFAQERSYLIDLNTKQVTELGTLGGNSTSVAGINNPGQVVGYSATSTGETHAFITGPGGVGMRDLGTLGGDISYATGINDLGQAVGSSATGHSGEHAFITGANGTGMTDLGTLGGVTVSLTASTLPDRWSECLEPATVGMHS